MGYNIDSIDIVSSDGFCISRPKLEELAEAYGDDTAPEQSIFDEDFAERCCDEFRGMLFPKSFPWFGEGSGHSFELLRDTVLPAFSGSVDLVLTWEGGHSHSGLRLLNGNVTEHEVTLALGAERKK